MRFSILLIFGVKFVSIISSLPKVTPKMFASEFDHEILSISLLTVKYFMSIKEHLSLLSFKPKNNVNCLIRRTAFCT